MIDHAFSYSANIEKPSFESVYQSYYLSVVKYLQKKIGNIHDAEDLAAETFLYCYQNYDRYDPAKSAVSTWIYLAANCRLKNYYRDKKEYMDLSELEERLFVEDSDMEQAAYLDDLRRIIGMMLQKLPERQQRAVIMRFFQQKEFSEIASSLGTTSGNARVILTRALDKLEREFSAMREDWSV